MITRRLLLSVAGATAMVGLVGSGGPNHVRRPSSTMDIRPEATLWAGAPIAHLLSDEVTDLVAAVEQQQRDTALTARLAEIDAGSVDLAVATLDRRTGRAYSYAGTKQFRTASVVKVDILATLLWKATKEGRSLSTTEQKLATAMIRNSDNDAASTLWRRTGGIAASMAAFGLTSTRQGSDGDWGETTTTAEDQLRLLQNLADPQGTVPNGAYVLDLMSTVANDQDWGVSAAAKDGERTALKNGWYPVSGGWILNSVGRITDATGNPGTDLLIVVLSRGHPSYASGIRTVEEVAARVRAAV